MAEFKDHFSTQSKGYGTFRPHYPDALYLHLSDLCSGHERAWDCATGTGQAARGLVPYFTQIVASDASAAQIEQAYGPDSLIFKVARGENSGLAENSVDLVTVAQALHWFAHDEFYEEVKRVLKPGGVFAAWGYNFLRITPEIDRLVDHFSETILGIYWPAERQLVNDDYRTISFPFKALAPPVFHMIADWDLAALMGYLDTWSAVARYKADQGRDPMNIIRAQLEAAWGDASAVRRVTWPLTVKVGRV